MALPWRMCRQSSSVNSMNSIRQSLARRGIHVDIDIVGNHMAAFSCVSRARGISTRAFSPLRPSSLSSSSSSPSSLSSSSSIYSFGVFRNTYPRQRGYSQFQPLVPPSPESLGKARPARQYRRTRRLIRRLIQLSLVVATITLSDIYFFDAVLTRSTRTFATGLLAALDYKINFRPNPPFADSLADVHHRNAERLFHLLRNNGGLYLKIGQAIAMQSAILPPEFQKMFASMFDDAPQNSWDEVRRVIREDFGKEVEEVFGVGFDLDDAALGDGRGIMERTARASASVAQVHWARLADGREVAIKIQKREIERQVGWDLWAFKYVSFPRLLFFPLFRPVANLPTESSPKSTPGGLTSHFTRSSHTSPNVSCWRLTSRMRPAMQRTCAASSWVSPV